MTVGDAVIAAIQRRRRALVAAGLDPDPAVTRGPGFANEVWIGDEVVVRIHHAAQVGGDPLHVSRTLGLLEEQPGNALRSATSARCSPGRRTSGGSSPPR